MKTQDVIDAWSDVLRCLPAEVQRLTVEHRADLEEIYLDVGRALTFNVGIQKKTSYVVTLEDVRYVRDKVGGFRSDYRAGLEGTLHRFSGVPDEHERLIGMTIRLSRHVFGVAECLRSQLEKDGSMMVVGPPGVGKTTLLRDIVHILGERYGMKCVVVDTSNEIGGDGILPHAAIGEARRMKVGNPKRQGEVLRQAVANHGPEVIVVDEIGYHGGDVELIETTSRRGVRVVSTLHGHVLRDVLQNPRFSALLGNVNLHEGRRTTDTVFKSAVEVRGKGKLVLHPNLQEAVDKLLQGLEPGGIRLGDGWKQEVSDGAEAPTKEKDYVHV